ncbi:sialate O-acetylesterase [Niameybacter massiliensis]|uniref:sialate O-acetylesterase n=1 Tax=Niameybacter massiliensis TaxID=1658108 RepID=UPI0006B69C41|nr:sialate O-acetylesterase [Niameybacter massiliensis]
MNIGAIITQGPQPWQIIQQVEGKANITLKGTYDVHAHCEEARVWARVVLEDTFENVIRWQEATKMQDGEWEIILKEVPAGGLYRIETCLKENIGNPIEWAIRGDMIHHVGIGDLFVIAGQSNSAGYGKGPVFDPPELGIHLLRNSGQWDLASHPFNESTHTLHSINREGANPGHSPYLSFAKRLKRDLAYPIGLIQTALGGSPLSAWNPEEEGYLYHNMLEVIQSTTDKIKGVLWYQGCTDTDTLDLAHSYLERFKTMVQALRKDLNQPELPILTVQLNRVVNNLGNETAQNRSDEGWSMVREAQRQATMIIDNVYIIPSIDSTLSDAIHNASPANMVLGERMARLALEQLYDKGIEGTPPNLQSASLLDTGCIELTFAPVYERLESFDVAVSDLAFQIEDSIGKIELASYQLLGNRIQFKMSRKPEGDCYVSCGQGRFPRGVVPIDRGGQLPLLLFNKAKVNLHNK